MSGRNEISSTNQTEFVDQAVFFENKSSGIFNFKDFRKNKSLRPFYILMFLLFFFLLIFILGMVFRKKPEKTVIPDSGVENVKLDPLNQRVSDLREDLKDHDPTKQSLPFPEVDLEFNIN